VGGSLSGSKVVRGMVFGRESEGAFCPHPPFLHFHQKLTWIKRPPHTGTIKHATTAKVAVFMCTFDIAQTETTEGTALIKHADETTSEKEEHLAEVRFLFFFLSIFSWTEELIHPSPHPQIIK
jgi:hypothetical protein